MPRGKAKHLMAFFRKGGSLALRAGDETPLIYVTQLSSGHSLDDQKLYKLGIPTMQYLASHVRGER